MEFYLNLLDFANVASQFQFPTGWNSTKATKALYIRKTEVSIPNGMEFYIKFKYLWSKWSVSIPNGMEFYENEMIERGFLQR